MLVFEQCAKHITTQSEAIKSMTPVFARIKSGDRIEILEQPDWCKDSLRYVFCLNGRPEQTPVPSMLYNRLSRYTADTVLTVTNVTHSPFIRDGRKWLRVDYELKEQ